LGNCAHPSTSTAKSNGNVRSVQLSKISERGESSEVGDDDVDDTAEFKNSNDDEDENEPEEFLESTFENSVSCWLIAIGGDEPVIGKSKEDVDEKLSAGLPKTPLEDGRLEKLSKCFELVDVGGSG
jgi:hypothetical protein